MLKHTLPASVRCAGFLGAHLLGVALERAQAQALTAEWLTGGFDSPVAAAAPIGDARIFVAEQFTGRVRVLSGSAILATPYLDLSGKLKSSSEQGLLGLCFHPNYETTGYVYVAYTDWSEATVVERYQRSTWNPNQADLSSALRLITVAQPFPNHNGGCIQFGPDGYLYIGLGDGGGSDDPYCNAQDLGSWLGKLLRIGVEKSSWSQNYSIPPDNPFVSVPGARPEIYALGLRNPWRFSFDRQTGDILIGDVGEAQREEISFSPLGVKGRNFGWRVMEGNLCNGVGSCSGSTPACWSGGFTAPIHEYSHDFGSGGCSVIGGYVYRGCALPELRGTYFFADYCTSSIWSFRTDGASTWEYQNRTEELTAQTGAISTISSFGEDGFGEILIVSYGGSLYRIRPAASATPCNVLVPLFERGSIASGVRQSLLLKPGTAQANQAFVVLGSASGTWPGFMYGGYLIPLNFDPYFLANFVSPSSSPIETSSGVLSPKGQAYSAVDVPVGVLSSTLIGATFHHAFVVLDAFGAVRMVSNPVPLTLVP